MLSFFLAGLFIFAMRVLSVSLATTRLMMVVQGRKLLAWITGFFQALIFITIVRDVLLNIGDWTKVLAYSGGFATGVIVGMMIESRIALGYIRLHIISPSRGKQLANSLRENGFGLTEIPAKGKDGAVTLINCNVTRRQVNQVVDIVTDLDPEAFITAESVRSVQRGFWRN